MQHACSAPPPLHAAAARRAITRLAAASARMPRKQPTRCYKVMEGIPILRAQPACANCQFLLDEGQTGHKEARYCYPCRRGVQVITPVPRDDGTATRKASLRATPAAPQRLVKGSPIRNQSTGSRHEVGGPARTPKPAVQQHPDREVVISVDELPGFPFMPRLDGTAVEGQLQLFEFQTVALAEHILALDAKSVKVNNAYFFSNGPDRHFLSWLRKELQGDSRCT